MKELVASRKRSRLATLAGFTTLAILSFGVNTEVQANDGDGGGSSALHVHTIAGTGNDMWLLVEYTDPQHPELGWQTVGGQMVPMTPSYYGMPGLDNYDATMLGLYSGKTYRISTWRRIGGINGNNYPYDPYATITLP